jgi:hypothetical protein
MRAETIARRDEKRAEKPQKDSSSWTILAGWLLPQSSVLSFWASCHWDFMQADILNGRPNNRQAAGLGGKDVDLISPLAHEAPQTFNGIGALNVLVHHLRKSIKGQEVLFILSQASHRFGIALSILGGSRQPIGLAPLAVSVAPRYQPVRLGHRRALVWG